MTGETYSADQLLGRCKCGQPLLVRYDLDALRHVVSKDDLLRRAPDMWRYREFLPVRSRRELAATDGLNVSPEGAATLVALREAIAGGRVKKTERVVLFNCASGLKHPLEFVSRRLDRHQPIDFASL
jgi:threonine synthase